MSYTLLSIIIISINIALLCLILAGKSKGRIFSITLFGAIIWSSVLNLLYSGTGEDIFTPTINLYLVRVSFWGAIITVTGLVLFERSYLRAKKWNGWLYAVGIFFLGYLFVFTPAVVKNIFETDKSPYNFEYGILYPVYAVTYLGLFINAYIRILHRFFTTKRKIEKIQLRFFVLGISFSFWIGIFTNLIYPALFGDSSLSRYGPLGLVFTAIFTTYAIFKHHLFDIKMILSEILLGLMGIILFVYIFISESAYEVIVSTVFFILFTGVAYTLLQELLQGIAREHQLERANNKLIDTIESKDLFLRMTSHQLRTPLTSLNGFLSLILEQWQGKYKMNQATHDDLVVVYLSAQRLIAIVNDILAFNAIKADRFGVIMRPKVNVKDELNYLLQDNKYVLEYFDTEVILKSVGSDFNISMDSVRMKEVFQNLLSNGVYYGKGKIWITIIDEGDRLQIRFRDNGHGIDPSIKDKIFKPRFRARGVGDQNPNGSGLGLFISRTIVGMHHGTLKLKNPGSSQGAVFVVKIPKVAHMDKYEGQ
jgi:signal transduction histidine kinase